MRFDRDVALAVLRDVIAACDPATRVREALGDPEIAARFAGRRRFAIAIGKAALAMARGAGEVTEGIAVVPRGSGGALPRGWRLFEAAHPEPDEHSVAAGLALLAFVRTLQATDVVLALISGGASALAEVPRLPLDEFVATIRGVMAAGAPIDEINTVRGALSAIKAGQLALASAAPVVTLAVSDVIGDALAVIGSGPTVGPWLEASGVVVLDALAARRSRAREILARHGVAVPAVLAGDVPAAARARSMASAGRAGAHPVARTDLARVIAPMASAAHAAVGALASRGVMATVLEAPIAGEVEDAARCLVNLVRLGEETVCHAVSSHIRFRGSLTALIRSLGLGPRLRASLGLRSAPLTSRVEALVQERRPGGGGASFVAWGEPTLRVPAVHGTGGRAQQLALVLARELRGSARAALVVGTDGVDGPPPADRSAPAGAWVDGTTWDAIVAAGCDPAGALAACDAGTALAAVGALIVTGPSGINHADLVILGG